MAANDSPPASPAAGTSEPTAPGAMTLLARARAGIERLSPQEALAEQGAGALIVDVRTEAHRRSAAHIPGALVIDLTVLPWRLDPAFAWRIPEARSLDQRWIIVCRHGYSSALAAFSLRQMGLHRAADIDGGFEAWAAAGLPLTHEPADVRE